MVLPLHDSDILNECLYLIKLYYNRCALRHFKAIDLCICKYSKQDHIWQWVACYREHAVCTPASRALDLLKYHGMYVNISMERGHHTDYYPCCFIARLFQSQGRTFLWAFVFHCAFTPIKPPVTHIAVCCRLLSTLREERGVSCSDPNPHINTMQPFNSAFVVIQFQNSPFCKPERGRTWYTQHAWSPLAQPQPCCQTLMLMLCLKFYSSN